jgi:hypothetical protein
MLGFSQKIHLQIKPILFLVSFIFCFSFCLAVENNYTEKNNLPKPTPHFLFSHFIPPGFDLFSPNYQFISDFIAAEGEDNVRRIGPDDEGENDQDSNDLKNNEGTHTNFLAVYNTILNPNHNTEISFEWSSDWFTDNQLGVYHIPIGHYSLLMERDSFPGPSFLLFSKGGNTTPFRGVLHLLGPLNVNEFSTDFGLVPSVGALMGGHSFSPNRDYDSNTRPIDINNDNMVLVMVMDRNGITLGEGFEGNIPGSMNRQAYYWGYQYTNMVNMYVRFLELSLLNGIAQVCTFNLIGACEGGFLNDVIEMSNLDRMGRRFEGNEVQITLHHRINALGFRYRVSLSIIGGLPQLTLHWENHTYQIKGEIVMHRFLDQNNRHPRKLSEEINFLHGKPIAIENDHIKSTENLHLGQMLFSEDESKVLIPAKEGLHTFDMPKGSSEINLLQKIMH